MHLIRLAWAVGERIPARLGDVGARFLAPLIAALPLRTLRDWQVTAGLAAGRPMTGRDRSRVVEVWLRNTLWSLSLARWSDADVLSVAEISEADVSALRSSLEGPGLVLALPHMGSWDFAGAWCARAGIPVVSVAERLPGGGYELFRDARAGMGMEIHPVDQPDLMRFLAADVRAGKAVCLLSDRDLSARGVSARWPGAGDVKVPGGPALLARRTGADLRVASTRFDGPRLHLDVSDPVTPGTVAEMMQGVVDHFARAVRASPTDWLMLRRIFT